MSKVDLVYSLIIKSKVLNLNLDLRYEYDLGLKHKVLYLKTNAIKYI